MGSSLGIIAVRIEPTRSALARLRSRRDNDAMADDIDPSDSTGIRQRFARSLEERPRLRRELNFLAGAFLVGIILMPLLIYVAGVLTLGPYTSGGLGSFLGDFFLGLLRGVPSNCLIAVGPYAGLMLIRMARLILRRFLSAPEPT